MNIKTLLKYAVEAAVEAGQAILDIYNDPAADFGIERKADNSPLTRADKRAHETIASRLAPTGIPLLSEEGRATDYAERRTWSSLWIVDPLDGTKEFIKRNGEFTVNIALVTDGVPVLGVIYVPVSRELYFGADGLGAYKLKGVESVGPDETADSLAGRAARLPLGKDGRDTFVVVASRSHLSPETAGFIEALRAEHPSVETVSSGSSIKICLVAEGSADVYPRFAPTMEWDTAAGHAIARNAGCQLCRAGSDTPLAYNKAELLNPWFVAGPVKTQTENP